MITKHRDDMVPCQRCQERYREDDPMCPHCGYPLPDTRKSEASAKDEKPAINFNPPPVPKQFAGMRIPMAAEKVPMPSPAAPPRAVTSPKRSFGPLVALAAAAVAVGAWLIVKSQ